VIVEFIDMYRGYKEQKSSLSWSVESMCQILTAEYGTKISVSGYYGFKKRPPSARSRADEVLKEAMVKIYEENYFCYGVVKMWRELRRKKHKVARCTTERLMKDLGIVGKARTKTKRTTRSSKNGRSAKDLVRRNFASDRPNALWVADFTYVSTQEGYCYVAFVVDVYARAIVGHCVSTRMNKDMVANAFHIAAFNRTRQGLGDFESLIHRNDKGSQYTSDDFVELLFRHGIKTSIGAVGCSFDNALAETINGTYKNELIYNLGPWESYEHLNLETEKWIKWYNEKRINEYCDWQTPCEVEQLWYATGDDFRKGSKSER